MEEEDALDDVVALELAAALEVSEEAWVDFALVSDSAFFAPPAPE